MEGAVYNLADFDGIRVAILGDMYELGDYTDEAHQYISDLCEKVKIDEVYLIGEYFSRVKNTKWKKFKDISAALEFFKTYDTSDKNILIKASRSMELERLYPILGILPASNL
jgi:UDP-N-acetylmuramoyl-tripeptide--D-alanyl-D-alanine ligase